MVEKLKITAFVVVRNGTIKPNCFNKCLESLSFADQLIVVDDSSWDSSIAVAKKYTDEIYSWYGSDSMAERRNYAMGFKGNAKHTPEWISHPIMSKNHPVVKHDWIMYIDSDEHIIQHPDAKPIVEVLKENMCDPEPEGFALQLINLIPGRKVETQTTSPLLRIFRTPTVWFEGAVQHAIKHGNPIKGIPIVFYHYGYSTKKTQDKKYWNRLHALQEQVELAPNDLSRRKYLINNLSGIVINEMNLEETMAQFIVFKEVYLKDPRKEEDDNRMLLYGACRHIWHACLSKLKFLEFKFLVEDIAKYIDEFPDFSYWMLIIGMEERDLDAITKAGEKFFELDGDPSKTINREMESESSPRKHIMAKALAEAYVTRAVNADNDLIKKAYFACAEKWNKRYIELV